MDLNRKRIDETPAGPALDALVAEAMGCLIEPFSTDQSRALNVWLAGLVTFGTAMIYGDMEDYGRGMILGDGPEEIVRVSIGNWIVADKLAPAICRAYLQAHLGPPPEEEGSTT